MQKPIKYAEKALTVAAGAAWTVFDKLNQINQPASFTPKWSEKPLLKTLSFLLKPIFEANHRWAMAQGETSLALELARRRATSDAARARVPPPPGPVTYAGVVLVAGAAAVAAGVAYLLIRAARRR